MSKKLIKSLMHKAGFELHRLNPVSNPAFQLLKGFDHFGVDLVFDIGANTGQFCSELRSVGYKGRLISFEPLPEVCQALMAAAVHDPLWHVHSHIALGDTDGEIMINIAGNSVSSSILPMLETHSTAAEGSAFVDKVKVPIAQLDSVADEYLNKPEKYFIKIDTQGFEWEVLNGAQKTLANAQGVLCELSLIPLYEGQRLWIELIERLETEGFTLWSIQKGFTDPYDGRTLQVDAIFFKVPD